MFCTHFALGTLVAGALLGAVALEPVTPAVPAAPVVPAAGTPVRVLPDTLELGARSPESETRASLWLVNEGDAPVTLREAKPGCGCVRFDEGPRVVPARGALELSFTARAPKEDGARKSARVSLLLADGVRLAATVSVTADAAAPAPRETAPHASLAAAPEALRLPDLAPGERHATSLWLVNRSEAPVRLAKVVPGCGCTVASFQPTELVPGAALEVPLAVTASKREGRMDKSLRVLVEGGEPLVVPLRYRVVARADAP